MNYVKGLEIAFPNGEKMGLNFVYEGDMTLSNHVIISDPCYTREQAAAILADVVPGKYHCYVLSSPTRVLMLVAMHETFPLWDLCADWGIAEAKAGVDSAQCGVFDSSVFPEKEEEIKPFLKKCYDATTGSFEADTVSGKGFVSSSGGSDGSYPFYVTSKKDGFAINYYFYPDSDAIAILNATKAIEKA